MNAEPRQARQRVLITGYSAVSPLGIGGEALIEGLWSGRDGFEPVPGEMTAGRLASRAALVTDFEPRRFIPAMKLRRMDNSTRFSLVAAELALRHAGLLREAGEKWEAALDLTPLGIYFGTATAGSTSVAEYLQGLLVDGVEGQFPMLFPNTVPNAPAGQLAIRFGIRGPNATVAQREASALQALALAADAVGQGRCPRAVVVGVDEYSTELLAFYDRMGFLSPGRTGGEERCRPYSARRNGWMAGEGAYALVIESAAAARDRGTVALGHLAGAGWSGSDCSTYRWPEGWDGYRRCMAQALEGSGLETGEVGAVLASANGNRVLDHCEGEALADLFDAGGMPPVTAVKSLIGESGACGAAQAIAALAILDRGSVPPTGGGDPVDAGGPAVNLVTGAPLLPETAPRAVLVNSFASGGSNISLVIKHA